MLEVLLLILLCGFAFIGFLVVGFAVFIVAFDWYIKREYEKSKRCQTN